MVKTRQQIRRIPFIAPAALGVEVMSIAQLRAMAPPGYLERPQRPAFHLLIFSTAGVTTHTVDFAQYRLGPYRTLWVRPGQVQRFGDLDPPAAGELVLFEPDFLIPHTAAAVIANDRLGPVAIDHDARGLASIGRARRELRAEYVAVRAADRPTAVQTEALRLLLSVLVLRLSPDPAHPVAEDRSDLDRGFRELLERDFAVAHDVGHYVRALGYSGRTLARATVAATGQTPKAVIQERLALEARRLLVHTSLPVATVARRLGFQDPSNFSAFFAHQTGDTPTAFRHGQRP